MANPLTLVKLELANLVIRRRYQMSRLPKAFVRLHWSGAVLGKALIYVWKQVFVDVFKIAVKKVLALQSPLEEKRTLNVRLMGFVQEVPQLIDTEDPEQQCSLQRRGWPNYSEQHAFHKLQNLGRRDGAWVGDIQVRVVVA